MTKSTKYKLACIAVSFSTLRNTTGTCTMIFTKLSQNKIATYYYTPCHSFLPFHIGPISFPEYLCTCIDYVILTTNIFLKRTGCHSNCFITRTNQLSYMRANSTCVSNSIQCSRTVHAIERCNSHMGCSKTMQVLTQVRKMMSCVQ